MLVRQLALALAIAVLSDAIPTSIKHVLHEKRHKPASDWVKGARVKSDAVLPVRIGLAQNNLDKGYDFLMEVSDPKSSKYGQYWSADEVHDIFQPSEEAVEAVREWLVASGIHPSRVVHSDNKGWLAFDAYAHEAERLFMTEFHEHESDRSAKIRVGCDQYHVPEHIQKHIDYVTPGVKLTQVVKRTKKVKRASQLSHSSKAKSAAQGSQTLPSKAKFLPEDLRGCGYNITPSCIKALYQIPDAKTATPNNSLGLYEQGDYFAKSDLDLFYKEYAPWVPQGTYPIPALIDGANYSVPSWSSLNTGESDIDIDMAYSLLYPQQVTLYQVDDQLYEPVEVDTTNLFNTFLDALDGSYCTYSAYGETGDDPSIDPVYPDPRPGGYKGKLQCGVYKPTNVISASYGQSEADLPVSYTKRQCNEFMKLGLQGHSILFASGDYGVASFAGDGDENGCLGPEGKIFNPQYPSNCPYVTSVGGTMLYGYQTVNDSESVMHVNLGGTASNFSTSGGFSNYFPQPAYQYAAVEQYFQTANLSYPYYSEFEVDVNTTKGLYNRLGRAYPDVSANGAHFRAYMDGYDYHWYGSSLASPLFASVLTLLNEERFAIGKGPIGFVNPVLYAYPQVLNDITNGTNAGCGTYGFSAIQGWDPASGLGTPNYPLMRELFLSLP
ncbi:S53 family peptidase [Aspergillus neoniger CBS 115656]|uniref:Protease S8 tripeptidyl peptidase I n=1 Tax=Aspergillus neoniger (strain CBS 115656) TaxID=1448310 RepID=A0A318YVV9_ASPNB|nr:protease S8 tripeptidyl peptidase I [Aspergillus neoniger CBS 115656]PYH32008.1 protease S8 tripeptidyl peptidase I [Aspergillus neoniger CBS 115656]